MPEPSEPCARAQLLICVRNAGVLMWCLCAVPAAWCLPQSMALVLICSKGIHLRVRAHE